MPLWQRLLRRSKVSKRTLGYGVIWGFATAMLANQAAFAAPLLSVDFDQPASGSPGDPNPDTETGSPSLSSTSPQTIGSYTVTVTIGSGPGGSGFYARDTGATPNEPSVTDTGSNYGALYDDFAYINYAPNEVLGGTTNAIDISIKGVMANTPYQVTLYSYDKGGFGGTSPGTESVTTFRPEAGSDTTDTTDPNGQGTVTYSQPTSPLNGDVTNPDPTYESEYATTLTLMSSSTELDIQATAVSTHTTNAQTLLRVNGFQLSAVPEPATLSVLSIGSLGLLARRRRR
jgi:hypothetical protein